MVRKALARGNGGFDDQDIFVALEAGDMQLWQCSQGIVVTEIRVYPQTKACLIVLCAGADMETWIHNIRIIEWWAKEQGCSVVEAYGRAGWRKWLPDYETRAMFMKDLSDAGR